MKNQVLFSLKDKSKKKIKCRLLQFLFGVLRVKNVPNLIHWISRKPEFSTHTNCTSPDQATPCASWCGKVPFQIL